MRLKLWIDGDVLDQAARKAEAETAEGTRPVYVADVLRDAIFGLAAQEGDAAEHVTLRDSTNRRRYPVTVKRAPYEAAKERLRSRGISVAAAAEEGAIRYVQGRKIG